MRNLLIAILTSFLISMIAVPVAAQFNDMERFHTAVDDGNDEAALQAIVPLEVFCGKAFARTDDTTGLIIRFEDCFRFLRAAAAIAERSGRHDLAERFRISALIYGTPDEVARLNEAHWQVWFRGRGYHSHIDVVILEAAFDVWRDGPENVEGVPLRAWIGARRARFYLDRSKRFYLRSARVNATRFAALALEEAQKAGLPLRPASLKQLNDDAARRNAPAPGADPRENILGDILSWQFQLAVATLDYDTASQSIEKLVNVCRELQQIIASKTQCESTRWMPLLIQYVNRNQPPGKLILDYILAAPINKEHAVNQFDAARELIKIANSQSVKLRLIQALPELIDRIPAIPEAERLKAEISAAGLLMNAANYLDQQGNSDAAISLLRTGLDRLFARQENPLQQPMNSWRVKGKMYASGAFCLLASLERRRGNLTEFAEAIGFLGLEYNANIICRIEYGVRLVQNNQHLTADMVAASLAMLGPEFRATVDELQAYNYSQKGQKQEAISLRRRILRQAEDQAVSFQLALAQDNLARELMPNAPQEALPILEQAITNYERTGARNWNSATGYWAYGGLLKKLDRLADAEAAFTTAVEQLTPERCQLSPRQPCQTDRWLGVALADRAEVRRMNPSRASDAYADSLASGNVILSANLPRYGVSLDSRESMTSFARVFEGQVSDLWNMSAPARQ